MRTKGERGGAHSNLSENQVLHRKERLKFKIFNTFMEIGEGHRWTQGITLQKGGGLMQKLKKKKNNNFFGVKRDNPLQWEGHSPWLLPCKLSPTFSDRERKKKNDINSFLAKSTAN